MWTILNSSVSIVVNDYSTKQIYSAQKWVNEERPCKCTSCDEIFESQDLI